MNGRRKELHQALGKLSQTTIDVETVTATLETMTYKIARGMRAWLKKVPCVSPEKAIERRVNSQ